MRYNPHVVSRVERQAFQMIGDRVEQKMKRHQEMTAAERDSYWTTAIRRTMQSKEVNRA